MKLERSCIYNFSTKSFISKDEYRITPGNFSLPGIIDLPTANHFPDGELVFTHQNHKYIFMSGISFKHYHGLVFPSDTEGMVVGVALPKAA